MRARALMVGLVALLLVGLAPAVARAASHPSSGYGDWSCRPSAAHPEPVVLLHGLGGDPTANFAYLGPALAAAGYCAFAAPYSPPAQIPVYGLAAIDKAADDVVAFIAEVRKATGAAKVDLVGHSEGAFLSLYVPKVKHLADQVATVVAMAPPTHGTTFLGLVTLGQRAGLMGQVDPFLRQGGCAACADLIVGGPAVARLNDGPIAQPGVRYTVIATLYDELVRNQSFHPSTDTAFVREPGVTNLYLQDRCPLDPAGHVGLAFDGSILGMVLQALDPGAPTVTCSVGLPA
jgi:pimeloyl-ACP methyl ester carboxylesterase